MAVDLIPRLSGTAAGDLLRRRHLKKYCGPYQRVEVVN